MTQDHDNGRVLAPWQQAAAEFDCDHHHRELRRMTLSNGAVQYRRQCVECGTGGQAIKKDDAAREQPLSQIPPYDQELEADWYERRRQRALAIRAQERDARSEARFAEMDVYYKTSIWFRRRDYVLARDNNRCQAFLPGCTRQAEQVHHLTYDHFRNEPLFDLISVCINCHDAITAMDQARRRGANN